MSKMTERQIAESLARHASWIVGKDDGEKLNWTGADLGWADLRDANLLGASLRGILRQRQG